MEALRTGVPGTDCERRPRSSVSWRDCSVSLQDTWALKGALELIARIGTHARATRDVDANWRRMKAELDETLDAVNADLKDGFEFEIGDAATLEGKGPEGALAPT